jgi:hypothetical protein
MRHLIKSSRAVEIYLYLEEARKTPALWWQWQGQGQYSEARWENLFGGEDSRVGTAWVGLSNHHRHGASPEVALSSVACTSESKLNCEKSSHQRVDRSLVYGATHGVCGSGFQLTVFIVIPSQVFPLAML